MGASPLQFERVPSLDNRIPLLVQDRVPNPCLTKANDTCIFLFTYNGVEYFRCTYADSPTPWCATMVDPNNTVVTNRWGDCSTSQFPNCPEDTPDLPSCTAESGASCVFPFRHLGITYSSCASTDLLSSAWCSTSTHENGTHILGTESVCSSTCPGATTSTTFTTTTSTTTTTFTTTTSTTTSVGMTTASTTTAAADIKRSCTTTSGPAAGKPCVFPFTFAGTEHTSCAEWEFGGVAQGEFWCSTKVDSEGNHMDGEGEYGFCSPKCSPINLFDLIQELLGDVETGRSTRHPNGVVAFAKNQ